MTVTYTLKASKSNLSSSILKWLLLTELISMHTEQCQDISTSWPIAATRCQRSLFWPITALKIKSMLTITARCGHLQIKICLCVCVFLTSFASSHQSCCPSTDVTVSNEWEALCEIAPSAPSFIRLHYSSDTSSSSCHFYLLFCLTSPLSTASMLEWGWTQHRDVRFLNSAGVLTAKTVQIWTRPLQRNVE